MHRPIFHGLIALICLSLGAFCAVWIIEGRPQPPEADLPGPRPVPVDWRVLEPEDVARVVTGTGRLQAIREVRLALEMGGRIASVWEELGDGIPVPGGTELVSLDVGALDLEIQAQQTAVELAEVQGRGAQSDLGHAIAALALARERLVLLTDEESRWIGLAETGRAERARVNVASQARLAGALAVEEAERGRESASSRVEGTAKELRLAQDRASQLADRRQRSVLRAPFDGSFSLAAAPGGGGRTLPQPGGVLAPLESIGHLIDTSTMKLTVDVHEDDIGSLFVGAAAMAAPHSRPGLLVSGRVSAIGARVNPALRSVPVEVTFEGTAEEPLGLPAGTFARVEIKARPARDALHVDDSWVALRSGSAVAFVIEAGPSGTLPVARARPITFLDGIHSGGRIVTSGLSPGERVITSSLELIGDGTELVLR